MIPANFVTSLGTAPAATPASSECENSGIYLRKKIIYMITLHLTIWCCQIWRQAKYLDMNERTKQLGDNIDWITKLFYYIEKRDEIYTNNDKLEQIRLDREKLKQYK